MSSYISYLEWIKNNIKCRVYWYFTYFYITQLKHITKIHPSSYDIEFSVDTDGEIEYIDIHEKEEEITKDQITELIKKVIDCNQLIIGERSTGNIDITEETISFDYRYCSDVGEDWDTDIWNDEVLTIPNDWLS